MYIFFLRFFAAVVVFTDTFKTLSKDFCSMKTYYLQVRIQNHWTVPLDTPLEPQPHHTFISSLTKNVISLHSAEGFLKSFVQQTA